MFDVAAQLAWSHVARMYVLSLVIFVAILKSFEYVRITSTISTMFFIIIGMIEKIGSFIFILLIILFSFACLDFFAFGNQKRSSRNLIVSLQYQFRGVSLGDVDFDEANEADAFWGVILLIIFVVVSVLLLLNLLIAVMSEAYEEVKNDASARWAYSQVGMLIDQEVEVARLRRKRARWRRRVGGGGSRA